MYHLIYVTLMLVMGSVGFALYHRFRRQGALLKTAQAAIEKLQAGGRAEHAEHRILQALFDEMITASDFDRLFESVSISLAKHFGFPCVWIDIYDAQSDTIRTAGSYDARLDKRGKAMGVGYSFSRMVIHTGRTVYQTDLEDQHEPGILAFRDKGFSSVLALPLGTKGQHWGVLIFADTATRLVVQRTLENFKILVDYLSLCVEKRRDLDLSKAAEASTKAIADATSSGIATIDGAGKILSVNSTFEQQTGYAGESVIGNGIDQIVPAWNLSGFEAYLRQHHQTGPRKLVGSKRDMEARHRDGHFFPIELNVSGQISKGGNVFTVVIRDLTKIKQMEQALQEGMERGTAATRAKSIFLANLSHEVRVPMNSIIGMGGLLAESELTKEQAEYIDAINAAAEGLLEIVNDIWDIAKMEAGELEITSRDFDLRSCLENIGDLLALKAQQKGLDLIIHLEESVPTALQGDKIRLRQVLLNLANNAIRFTRKGRILIRARLQDQKDDKVVLGIAVSDTGVGIPKERLPDLFKPFSNMKPPDSDQSGRTGLGLAISKQLVTLMGGSLQVNSKEGEGSTFAIELALPRQAEEPQVYPMDLLKDVRCLLWESDVEQDAALRSLLQPFGCRLDTVNHAEQALLVLSAAAKAADPFQILIFSYDSDRPETRQLLDTLKQDPLLTDTRLILLTTFPKRAGAMAYLKQGISFYLVKPIKRNLLLESICSLMGIDWNDRRPFGSAGRVRLKTPSDRGRNYRILVAEDNQINRELTLKLLERQGYRCDIAVDGEEAVSLHELNHYDLILMDMQMPVMDGFQATATIRGKGQDIGRVPIIAMTARAMEGDRERCLAAGMDDYLSKPVRPAILYALLEKFLA